MTPKDKQLIGEIVTAKHEELRSRPERLVLLDSAMIGAVLYLAKQVLPRRQYIPWLKEYTPLHQKAGARYMARMHQYLSAREADAEVEERMKELLFPPEALERERKQKRRLRRKTRRH
jgi:hypothetical protein